MSLHLVKRARSRVALALSITAAFACAAAARPAGAQATIGLVADAGGNQVLAFDADTGVVFGSVPIPSGNLVGDCALLASPTQTRAFVTDFNYQLWPVDLTTSPPSLPLGPIPIANPGEDVDLSADKQFAVTCDGSALADVSVVNTTTGVQVSTFSLGSDCNSVAVCGNGSVLVTSAIDQNVRRLLLDADGNLSDTGDALLVDSPTNLACAPGGASGIVASFFTSEIQSFTIPGLTPVDSRPLSAWGAQTVILSPDGTRAYARSTDGALDAFEYVEASGQFGGALFSVPVAFSSGFYGIDQVAVHPDGSRLYLSDEIKGVRILDSTDGATLASVALPSGAFTTGVCVATATLTPPVPPTPPPPPNDQIGAATVIQSLPYATSESTAGATTAPTDPDCSGNGHSVWYRYTAPSNQAIALDTLGSYYDTTLSVYTGSPPALTQIACNDDYYGAQSRVDFQAVAGTTYYIMVASFAGSQGGLLQLRARQAFQITLSNLSGKVSHVDGSVTLQGVVTCSGPASFVDLYPIQLRQRFGQNIAESFTYLFLPSCDGPTPWSVQLAASGPFKAGQATATVEYFGCDTLDCAYGKESTTVHLKGGKP